MSTTHAAMGGAIATLLAPIAPDLTPIAVAGAIAGGLFPDLDVGFEHRRTLHYPVEYWLLALPLGALAIVAPAPWSVGSAAFVAAAGLHSVTDVFGGGLGRRPWEADDDRGVYLHRRGRWIAPRRWIRFDGAPEDLALAALLSAPLLVHFEGSIRWFTVLGLGVSIGYTVFRRRLPDLHDRLV
ncbi:MAG: metal-dependent hydrolase [Halanaeroarchaeum sp.]